MENLHDKRKVYDKGALLEEQVKSNPIEQFRDWFLMLRNTLPLLRLML